MDEDQWEYRVYLHPQGKMWAIGRRGAAWKTLRGVTATSRGMPSSQGVVGTQYHFSHSGTPKTGSYWHMDSIIEEKLAKGYVRQEVSHENDWPFRHSGIRPLDERKHVLSLPTTPFVPKPAVVREAISTPAIPLVIVDTARLEAEGSVFIGF